MARFLVIGASGLIGRRLLRKLGPQNAVGTYRHHPFSGGVPFDMERDRIESLIAALGGGFTYGVVLGAVSNLDACAADPDGTARTNTDGAIRVIEGLRSQGIVPIFASSDGVYDGNRGGWREEDATRPILTYGRQKLAVERWLVDRGGRWIALRFAKVLDPELHPQGVLGPWIRQLAAGEHIRCAVDQRFTPVGIDDVAAAIERLASSTATGIFNLGGLETVSRFDLLSKIEALLARERPVHASVERCSIRDIPLQEPRPFDTSMSVAKLRSVIRFEPGSLESLCCQAVRSFLGAEREEPGD